MPATSTSPIKILTDLGYEMVDIESDTDYFSALREASNTIEAATGGSGDSRLVILREEAVRVRRNQRKAEDPTYTTKEERPEVTSPLKIKKKIISAEAFKKGSSVGGAEKAVPADTTGASALALRQPGGELSKDIEAPEQPASPLDGLLGIVQSIAGGVDSIK